MAASKPTRKQPTRKQPSPAKTIPSGTKVTWHYRSAVGHGTVVGIAKKGTNAGNTEYRIRETDHHVSATGSREPAIVKHYGRSLHRA